MDISPIYFSITEVHPMILILGSGHSPILILTTGHLAFCQNRYSVYNVAHYAVFFFNQTEGQQQQINPSQSLYLLKRRQYDSRLKHRNKSKYTGIEGHIWEGLRKYHLILVFGIPYSHLDSPEKSASSSSHRSSSSFKAKVTSSSQMDSG